MIDFWVFVVNLYFSCLLKVSFVLTRLLACIINFSDFDEVHYPHAFDGDAEDVYICGLTSWVVVVFLMKPLLACATLCGPCEETVPPPSPLPCIS